MSLTNVHVNVICKLNQDRPFVLHAMHKKPGSNCFWRKNNYLTTRYVKLQRIKIINGYLTFMTTIFQALGASPGAALQQDVLNIFQLEIAFIQVCVFSFRGIFCFGCGLYSFSYISYKIISRKLKQTRR